MQPILLKIKYLKCLNYLNARFIRVHDQKVSDVVYRLYSIVFAALWSKYRSFSIGNTETEFIFKTFSDVPFGLTVVV